MKKLLFYFLLFTAVSVVFYAGCESPTADKIDDKVIPDKDVSYQGHLQEVFNIKCATAGCHEDGSRAGGLSLTTWANTTADLTIVFPGIPDNSRLVWTIDPKFSSPTPMPPIDAGVTPLTANQIKGIRTWIAEGAKNN